MNSARGTASSYNPRTKRLMLALTAAVLCQFALSWLLSLVFSNNAASIDGSWGSLRLLDCVVTLVAMGLGGWIVGLRFLPVALLATAAIWSCSLLALAYTGQPLRNAPFSQNLMHGLRFNGVAIVCSLLAAAAGSWLGAKLGERRPLRFND